MVKLSGHSLSAERKLNLEAMSLTLTERSSSAEITMKPGECVGIDDWVRDETEPGGGMIWRVRATAQNYFTGTPTAQLEHIINTLRDRIVFGEVTAAEITGVEDETECSAREALAYILDLSDDWTMGDIDQNPVNAYKFDGVTLYDAVVAISQTMEDVFWTYDLSRYPFRLNIRNKRDGIGSELRANRNMRTISRTVDKSGMYTRFFPIGKDDLHISGECVTRNTGLYGIVDHVETDTTIETEEELIDWAEIKLRAHAEPIVTIDVDGLDLSEATGESLDYLTIGRWVRVPLPEYGTTITERLTQLQYPDKLNQPQVVRITLSNLTEDVSFLRSPTFTEAVSEAQAASGHASRGGAKQQKKDHAWFEDTDDHVSMCAIGIIGVDADGNPNWVRLSELRVDGEGIHHYVQELQNDMVIAETAIENNGREIRQEAILREEGEAVLRSSISQTATEIRSEVIDIKNGLQSSISQTASQIRSEVSDSVNSLSSSITQTASSIRTEVRGKVGKDEVISCINQSAESVDISASRINLSGYVTASELNTQSARITNLMNGTTTANTIRATNLYLGGYAMYRKDVTVGDTTHHLIAYGTGD